MPRPKKAETNKAPETTVPETPTSKDPETTVPETGTNAISENDSTSEELAKANARIAELEAQLAEKESPISKGVAQSNPQGIDCNGKPYTIKNDGGDELRRRGLPEEVVQNELELRKETTIVIPRDPYKDTDVRLFDPVRNKPLAIKRGVPVKVPGYISKALERSQEADIITAETMNKMANEFAEQQKEYNQ